MEQWRMSCCPRGWAMTWPLGAVTISPHLHPPQVPRPGPGRQPICLLCPLPGGPSLMGPQRLRCGKVFCSHGPTLPESPRLLQMGMPIQSSAGIGFQHDEIGEAKGILRVGLCQVPVCPYRADEVVPVVAPHVCTGCDVNV